MDQDTMNDLQRSLGRIEGNQESFVSEWRAFRDSQEARIVTVEHKIDKLDKFKNYASGAVGTVLAALSLITGIHISKHG